MKIMKKKLRLLARVMVVIMIIGLTYTGNFNNNIVLADTTDQSSNTKDTSNKGNKPPETDKSGQPIKANNQTSQVKDKNTKSNSNEIDEKIYGLSYDPKKILTLNGEKIENFVPAEGYEDSDKYVVIKREKKSISDSTADISIIDSINDRTYPGAIQLANRNLIENKPDFVSCERKPITISVDLPGMTSDGKKVV
ncbi:alveolysin, partial [Clostridium botulinum D/C]|uniref:thiol-activated cytolysin family protein n=1 Tax=Clostridium botulinum TaxID=1491 RepID=UPI001FA4B9E4